MVGAGGDDAGDEVVLQREDRGRVEGAVVGLRPEVGAGRRVDQLHRDAQLRRPPAGGFPPSRSARRSRCRPPARRPCRSRSARSSRARSRAGRRSATRPVTISSVRPSARASTAGSEPRCVKGRTATQKPSSLRRDPVDGGGGAVADAAGAGIGVIDEGPLRSARRAATVSRAVGKRSSGLFWRQREITARRPSGRSGVRPRWPAARRAGWPRPARPRSGPGTGAAPSPSRREGRRARRCRSGDRAGGPTPARGTCRARVPITTPSRVRRSVGICESEESVGSAAVILARPKSRTLTRPSVVTMTLAGLRSRWTMPFSWAAARASASAVAISRIWGGASPPSGTTRSRGWPSTSCMVRKWTPPASSTE